MLTPALVIAGDALTINANATGGEIRVQLLDERGDALEGFGFADMQPITRDGLDEPVKWKRELAAIAGRPVRLAFQMRQARLFGIDVR